jgi:hypothetical protein
MLEPRHGQRVAGDGMTGEGFCVGVELGERGGKRDGDQNPTVDARPGDVQALSGLADPEELRHLCCGHTQTVAAFDGGLSQPRKVRVAELRDEPCDRPGTYRSETCSPGRF